MKRFKHSLSNYKLLTGDMGKLIPCGLTHVLPGDSLQQSTSLLVRVSPLMAPVMHPVRVAVHHWFVPYRILWDGWEDFITGVSSVAPPTVQGSPGPVGWQTSNAKGSLWDYFGLPVGSTASVNDFAFRAYALIVDEFYRDQDLQAARHPNSFYGEPFQVAWEKDYFTTARPWAQKGPDVTIPLGLTAPVIARDPNGYPEFAADDNLIANQRLQLAAGSQQVITSNTSAGATGLKWDDPGLVADLTSATAANINDVRRAFALQRYQEARAQYGSRFTEYLRYLGIRPSDARLQRPEYLGGGKATISFSEVLKTGSTEDPAEPIGTMKGHGISAMRSRRWRRFFEEHGLVLSLLMVRPRTMYTDGAHREWFKSTKEDYWQKELELIGQQEVYEREVYLGATGTPTNVFGYQDRYAEYRHIPSTIAGDFRDTLNYWHLARSFSAPPVLNSDFIACDPGKRVFAEQTAHSLWIMAAHSIQARRLVTKSTVGRII